MNSVMKMKKKTIIWMMLAAAVLTLTSCKEKEKELVLDPSQFAGLWVKTNNTYEYWRFNSSSMTGITWDETPDPDNGEPEMTEEESNLGFSWSVERNIVSFVWHGLMENQSVPKYYYITEISSAAIVGEDEVGLPFTLRRVQ